MSTNSQILLVTPVWNDSLRLARFGPKLAQSLADSGLHVRWVIADDGSHEDELIHLKELRSEFAQVYAHVELMTCEQRFRKGGAIYQSWDQDDTSSAYAFVDADGAIDGSIVVDLLKAYMEDPESAHVGVRRNTPQAQVTRPLGRKLSFKLFTGMVNLMTGTQFEDTQCGLKVIPGAAYRSISSQLQERGFVFDVELLVALQARGVSIAERPIAWQEMPDGKVQPLRDAWAMLGGLRRIRKRMRSGDYSESD